MVSSMTAIAPFFITLAMLFGIASVLTPAFARASSFEEKDLGRRQYWRIAVRSPKRAHANVWTGLGGAAVFRRLLRQFEVSRLELWTSSLPQPDGFLYQGTMPPSGLCKRRRSLSAAEELLWSGRRLMPYAGIYGNRRCKGIRLTNEDVVDLYERVKVGAKVIVLQATAARRPSPGAPLDAAFQSPDPASPSNRSPATNVQLPSSGPKIAEAG
jgi:hypothetical protein